VFLADTVLFRKSEEEGKKQRDHEKDKGRLKYSLCRFGM
jgi:hypothetical protein